MIMSEIEQFFSCSVCRQQSDDLTLTESDDVKNAVILLCNNCYNDHSSKNKSHIRCFSCGKKVNITGRDEFEFSRLSSKSDIFVVTCFSCTFKEKYAELERDFIITNQKTFRRRVKSRGISQIYLIQHILNKIRRKYPLIYLSIRYDFHKIKISQILVDDDKVSDLGAIIKQADSEWRNEKEVTIDSW